MFQEITPEKLSGNAFDLFGTQKGIVCAASGETVGVMTIGWGTIGILWNLPVATVYVRPTRHTYTVMEESEYFSVCFFGEYTDTLRYLGVESGHDTDKVAGSSLQMIADQAPYFAEAQTVLLCKKIYAQPLDKNAFVEDTPLKKFYTNGKDLDNIHTTYVGEIIKVLVK